MESAAQNAVIVSAKHKVVRKSNMRDFRISQLCCWRFKYSWALRCVDFSKGCFAFIFRIKHAGIESSTVTRPHFSRTNTQAHTHTHTQAHTRAHTRARTQSTRARTHTRTHAHMCACTHTHAHTSQLYATYWIMHQYACTSTVNSRFSTVYLTKFPITVTVLKSNDRRIMNQRR